MKRVLAFLALIVCMEARGDIQTWSLEGDLIADEGDYTVVPGPAGSLNGHFNYDTDTQKITSFDFYAGSALFSSERPERGPCPSTPCIGSATVQSATKLVFEQNFTPASNRRLELFLSKPLDRRGGPIALDPQSVIYYYYGLATIHVLDGSISPLAPAVAAPEPAAVAAVLSGMAVMALLRASRRRELETIAGD